MSDSDSSADVPLRSLGREGARVVDPMEDSSDDEKTPRVGAAGRGGRAEVAPQGGSADGEPPAPAPRRREASPPSHGGEASPTVAPRPPSPDFSGVHPDVAKDPKYADFAADLKNKVPADKMRWPDPLAPRIARDTS